MYPGWTPGQQFGTTTGPGAGGGPSPVGVGWQYRHSITMATPGPMLNVKVIFLKGLESVSHLAFGMFKVEEPGQ